MRPPYALRLVWNGVDQLDRLLAIVDQAQQGAKKGFDFGRGQVSGDAALDVLRSQMRAFGWKGFGESRSKHDYELGCTRPLAEAQHGHCGRWGRDRVAIRRAGRDENIQECQDCPPGRAHAVERVRASCAAAETASGLSSRNSLR